jgi:hypothetical protein
VSGEAGATIDGELYSIFVGAGVRVNIAVTRGGNEILRAGRRRDHREPVDGRKQLGDFRSLNVVIQVKERVPRAALTALLEEIAATLNEGPP